MNYSTCKYILFFSAFKLTTTLSTTIIHPTKYPRFTVCCCGIAHVVFPIYRQTSNISRTNFQKINALKSGVKSRIKTQLEQRRRCSSYIWVINNFITYWGAACIRGPTVLQGYFTNVGIDIRMSFSLKQPWFICVNKSHQSLKNVNIHVSTKNKAQETLIFHGTHSMAHSLSRFLGASFVKMVLL